MTDNYEYTKSLEKQGMKVETPYVSKQWQYIPDSNGSSYQSSGLAPINFDLTSLVGDSDTMLNMSEAFIAIPLVLTSAYTAANDGTGGAGIPAASIPPCAWSSTTIKPYFNLVHQADVSINGTQVEQPVPFLNVKTSFKLMSSMSQNDLLEMGPILGMSNELDNVTSMKFTGSNNANYPTVAGGVFPNSNAPTGVGTASSSAWAGNGISNNIPFYQIIAANSGQSNNGDQGGLAQNNNTYNRALNKRAGRIIDLAGNTSKIYGVAGDATQNIINKTTGVDMTMTPNYQLQGNFMVWYDIAIIRLKDLFDSYAKLPHTRRCDSRIVLYCNLGTTGVMLMNGAANKTGQMIFSGNASNIAGTCPYIESFLGGPAVAPIPDGIPDNAVGKVTGIGIVKPTSIIQWGVNFAAGVAAHPMNQCRIYYPVCKFKPDIMKEYISLNRHKQIMFEKSYYLPVFKTNSGGFVSQQITSGARQVKSVLVVPVISQTTHGIVTSTAITGVLPFGEHQSPFSTFPMQNSPIPLINFNVKCGNIDVLSTPLYYNFEQFLEHFSNADAINPGDFGISNGLISDYIFNNGYKFYYLNLERGSDSQQMDMRSITVQYQNASLQEIDCHIFVSYFQSATIDIETSEFKLL